MKRWLQARRELLVAITALCMSACAGHTSRFDEALTAAEHEARSGRADEAARLYREAAQHAPSRDLAVEAAYREAWMWKRAGDTKRALDCLERLAAAEPASARSARIWLDIGRFREKESDPGGAREAYRRVLSYPESGLATRAADALVRQTSPRSTAYRELLPLAAGTLELNAFLRLRVAQSEVEEGNLRGAIATAEALAKDHPLPTAVYTDDALLLAARARRTLGDFSGALVTLDALLAAEEKAALVGSYERSTYAEARWLAADIQQIDLHDPARAERLLEDLASKDDTSRLKDDALFRAAWLAQERGHSGLACARARALEQLDPPSSLTVCLGEVCSALPREPKRSRRCERALSAAQGSMTQDASTSSR